MVLKIIAPCVCMYFSLWQPESSVELHVVSTTLGQLCAWRSLKPTSRASRLNTREKLTSLYPLLYRLSATTGDNNEADKTNRKNKKGVLWASFTGRWTPALVRLRLVERAVFYVPRPANWPWTGLIHHLSPMGPITEVQRCPSRVCSQGIYQFSPVYAYELFFPVLLIYSGIWYLRYDLYLFTVVLVAFDNCPSRCISSWWHAHDMKQRGNVGAHLDCVLLLLP